MCVFLCCLCFLLMAAKHKWFSRSETSEHDFTLWNMFCAEHTRVSITSEDITLLYIKPGFSVSFITQQRSLQLTSNFICVSVWGFSVLLIYFKLLSFMSLFSLFLADQMVMMGKGGGRWGTGGVLIQTSVSAVMRTGFVWTLMKLWNPRCHHAVMSSVMSPHTD